MPLVTTKKMLLDARQAGYAVAAFNIENLEMAQAVIDAAVKLQAPVILQTTSSTLRYAPPAVYAGMVRAIAELAPVPVALHLDHGDSFALAMRAICGGYTSLMIDGSHQPLEENIRLTKLVVAAAHSNNLPVEAELGRLTGKEDALFSSESDLTDPAEAAEFVRATGVDSLAVAIGTAHGVYKTKPVLNLKQLERIAGAMDLPLVLHGASGLTDGDIQACVQRGICKVNFATELRIAYTEGVRQVLCNEAELFDPKKYGRVAGEMVSKLAAARMTTCGCLGMAFTADRDAAIQANGKQQEGK
jgi:tagatose 1,6-diphosphate aldolase GatY/KbaY